MMKLHDRIHALENERDLLLNENNKIKNEFKQTNQSGRVQYMLEYHIFK